MSAASFKNLIAHYVQGKKIFSEETNVNDLLMMEENNFSGWECWAGVQNITIDNKGNVWRAICKQGDSLGSIYTDFTVPTETIICQKKKCNCAADIQLSKCLPKYKKIIRVGKDNE